jgi:hypothetical protein
MKNTLAFKLPIRWHDQREQQNQEGDGTNPGTGDGQQTPVPLISDDLTFRDGWQETLTEEHRAEAAKFKTLPDLIKSYRHWQTIASGKLDGMVKVPGEGATPEEVAAFNRARGVPDKLEDYGITKPEGEMAKLWNEDQVNTFLKEAHTMGLNKEQAAKLVQYQLTQQHAVASAEEAEGRKFMEEREATIKAAFGNRTDTEMNDARRLMLTIDPTFKLEDMSFLPANLVIGLAGFAKKLNPDTMVSQTQFQNKLTPTNVGTDIITNPNNADYAAYHDATHPQHEAVVKKVLDLHK